MRVPVVTGTFSVVLTVFCLFSALRLLPTCDAIRSSKSIWSINWFWRDHVQVKPIPPGVDPETFVKETQGVKKKNKAAWWSYKYWCSIFLPDYGPQHLNGPGGDGETAEENEEASQGQGNDWTAPVQYGVKMPYYPDYVVRVVPRTPKFIVKSVRF